MSKREPWIGFVHVIPTGPSPLGANRGAFVNVLALATDSEDYNAQAQAALARIHLTVIELSDAATVAEYAAEDRMSDDMWEIAASLSSEEPVQFHTFHAYDEPDA